MSYCVNCGVELDKTCEVCPLCHTKVVNPKEPVDHDAPTPFPSAKGTIEPVQNNDVAILMTVILASTAVVCGLLNLFFFPSGKWSLYVIGACILIWIFCLPLFFPAKINSFTSLILVYFLKYRNHSILSTAAMIIADLGIFSVSVELLLRHYYTQTLTLTWAAVILTCCIIIDCALITILRKASLRNEVRRRMHI